MSIHKRLERQEKHMLPAHLREGDHDGADLPSHGRGRWFDPSIAHS
jgi:hypothetical protein